MWFSLSDFYRSREWEDLRKNIIVERVINGSSVCEHCSKVIIKPYDLIIHHKQPLTLDNVNDFNISLNPDNLMIVHARCHNEIHNRFGNYTRHVYLVYGAPLSGKSSYVNSVATSNDLIIDVNRIRGAITGGSCYDRDSNRCLDNLFSVRNLLIDQVKYKKGKWCNAYIIGGYPYAGERERLCKELGAEPLFIEATEQECYDRLLLCEDDRDKKKWKEYIENWFRIATPPLP